MNRLYVASKSLDEYDLYDERMIDNAFEKEKDLESHSFCSIGTLNGRSRSRTTNLLLFSHRYGKSNNSLINVDMVSGSYSMRWYPNTISYQDFLDKLYFSFFGFKLCRILKIKVLNMHM